MNISSSQHTAIVMTPDGKYLMRESYNHSMVPAQNTEETEETEETE